MNEKPSMLVPAEPLWNCIRTSPDPVMIDSVDGFGVPVTRPRASTPDCAPTNAMLLATTSVEPTVYVPGPTLIVSPEAAAAVIAASIVA